MSDQDVSRRDVLRTAALSGMALAAGTLPAVGEATPQARGRTMIGVPFEPRDQIRIGIIGVGGRGMSLMNDLLAVPNCEIRAVCDIVRDRVVEARRRCVNRGKPEPVGYVGGERDFENMNARDDLDIVYVATPWDWHVPMSVDAMRKGKHVGVEVPAAVTLQECWDLVNVSEETRRHCVILENCCYGYWEMLVLNMCKKGRFGTLTHAEAAYIHDLRSLLIADYGEGLWRRYPHMERDGNLYPTHGLGPVANYFGVNRGDAFDVLVSLSSLEAGLTEYVQKHTPADSPKRREKYVCGDMNTAIIRTKLGRTIMLQHDVISPRPYSRINMVSGTLGTFVDYPARIFMEGQEGYGWRSPDPYREEFESPLWKRLGDLARELGGHGGMDYIMNYRLVQCMREGLPPDMDVYDSAAWSVPTHLSQESNKRDGAPMRFPDFTRGLWRQEREVMPGI